MGHRRWADLKALAAYELALKANEFELRCSGAPDDRWWVGETVTATVSCSFIWNAHGVPIYQLTVDRKPLLTEFGTVGDHQLDQCFFESVEHRDIVELAELLLAVYP